MGIHVLVVEDDEGIASNIRKALEFKGFQVAHAPSGEDAFFLVTSQHFDLLVLDLGLPGRGGLEVLTALRRRDDEIPVLVLSAKGAVEDRVLGLQAGADDYMTKPFSMDELEARLRGLLRRGRPEVMLRLSVGELSLDVALRQVHRNNDVVELTVIEFDLLELMMRRAHSIVSRETLAREIWKETQRATPLDNVIDVHIGRLRKKIDLNYAYPLIHTIRGVGFVLSDKMPG